jgi:hypothetical protein
MGPGEETSLVKIDDLTYVFALRPSTAQPTAQLENPNVFGKVLSVVISGNVSPATFWHFPDVGTHNHRGVSLSIVVTAFGHTLGILAGCSIQYTFTSFERVNALAAYAQ